MTNLKLSQSVVNVGVDVGKRSLDVCIHEKGIVWQDDNTPEGIRRILRRLAYYRVERLVMEVTGRYEFALAEAAYGKGLPVCIVKPLSVRRYAGAIEQLAKTDRIDAQCHPMQSGYPSLLQKSGRAGKAQEGGADSLHEEVYYDAECDGQRRGGVVSMITSFGA